MNYPFAVTMFELHTVETPRKGKDNAKVQRRADAIADDARAAGRDADAARKAYLDDVMTVKRVYRVPVHCYNISAPTPAAARRDARRAMLDGRNAYARPVTFTVSLDASNAIYNAAAATATQVIKNAYDGTAREFLHGMRVNIAAAAARARDARRYINPADITDDDAADLLQLAAIAAAEVYALFGKYTDASKPADVRADARAKLDAIAARLFKYDATRRAAIDLPAIHWTATRAAYSAVNTAVQREKTLRATTAGEDSADYLRKLDAARDDDAAADMYDTMDYSRRDILDAARAVACGGAVALYDKLAGRCIKLVRASVTKCQFRSLTAYADAGSMRLAAQALGKKSVATVGEQISKARQSAGVYDAAQAAAAEKRYKLDDDARAAALANVIDASHARAALDVGAIPYSTPVARALALAMINNAARARREYDNARKASVDAIAAALAAMDAASPRRRAAALDAMQYAARNAITAACYANDAIADAARARALLRKLDAAPADARNVSINDAARALHNAAAEYYDAAAIATRRASRARRAVVAIAAAVPAVMTGGGAVYGLDAYNINDNADAAAVDKARRLFNAAEHAADVARNARAALDAARKAYYNAMAIADDNARAAAIAADDNARAALDAALQADADDAARARAAYNAYIAPVDLPGYMGNALDIAADARKASARKPAAIAAANRNYYDAIADAAKRGDADAILTLEYRAEYDAACRAGRLTGLAADLQAARDIYRADVAAARREKARKLRKVKSRRAVAADYNAAVARARAVYEKDNADARAVIASERAAALDAARKAFFDNIAAARRERDKAIAALDEIADAYAAALAVAAAVFDMNVSAAVGKAAARRAARLAAIKRKLDADAAALATTPAAVAYRAALDAIAADDARRRDAALCEYCAAIDNAAALLTALNDADARRAAQKALFDDARKAYDAADAAAVALYGNAAKAGSKAARDALKAARDAARLARWHSEHAAIKITAIDDARRAARLAAYDAARAAYNNAIADADAARRAALDAARAAYRDGRKSAAAREKLDALAPALAALDAACNARKNARADYSRAALAALDAARKPVTVAIAVYDDNAARRIAPAAVAALDAVRNADADYTIAADAYRDAAAAYRRNARRAALDAARK